MATAGGFAPLQTYKVLKPTVEFQLHYFVLHHYKLTRFSNRSCSLLRPALVLHHYKLTRFSNTYATAYGVRSVLHHYKLTRFSNMYIGI